MPMIRLINPALRLLAAGLPAAAIASSPMAQSAAPTTLDPVTVTGSGAAHPELAPYSARNPFRTPQSSSNHTQTITREEIELLRPRDLFDLLNTATGVLATQGSRKGFSGLTIRGDSNFRWIVDGAYLQPTMAGRILKSLPVMAIEEVKIIRGSSALTLGPLVGSASPGGAPVDGFIVVRTRKPPRDEVQLRVALETQSTFQTGLWAGTRFDDAGGKAYLAGLATYGDTDGPGERLNNGAAYNAARTAYAGLAKAGIERDGWLVDLMVYKDAGRFEIPNANSHGPGQGSWFMDPARTDLYALSGSKSWDSVHTTLFSLSRTEARQKFWTANSSAGPYSYVQNNNFVTHLNLRHNVDFGGTRVMLGGDYMHWNAPTGQQYYEGIPREEKTAAGFVQIEQKLVDDRLTLDAALRREQVKIVRGLDYYTGGAQPFGGVNSPLRTTNNTLPWAHFWSTGASFAVFDGWKLTARYGQSRQATTGLNPKPGTSLADDQQYKWEVGIEGSVTNWLNPSVNFFHHDKRNEKSLSGYTYVVNNNTTQTCRTATIPSSGTLAPKTSSALTPCYAQSDTVRDGIELALFGTIAPQASYRASWTHFTRLANVSATTPRNIFDASFSYGIDAFTLSGSVKYVGRYKGSASDADAWLGGYTRIDLGIGYDFVWAGNSARATVYGRNLTDRAYETTNGVQDVGRVLGLDLTTRF